MNKFLRSTLAVVLTLSCFPLTNNKIEALSSNVNVTATDNQVVIGNEYIERQFSIADNKLETTNIINKRTESGNTVFTPANGSEEFIIKTVKEERAPISLEAIDRTNWSAVSDSYQNVSGPSDGPAANLIDGNLDSIWHSNYGGGTVVEISHIMYYLIYIIKQLFNHFPIHLGKMVRQQMEILRVMSFGFIMEQLLKI